MEQSDRLTNPTERVFKELNKLADLADRLSANSDMERIHRMVIIALAVDSVRHKQWYLYEIAHELGMPVELWDIDRGIAPK